MNGKLYDPVEEHTPFSHLEYLITGNMKNNQTDVCNHKHIWVCKEESGFLGEIVTFRRLTSVEINNLLSNKKMEIICPKGVIICGNCGQIIYVDQFYHI